MYIMTDIAFIIFLLIIVIALVFVVGYDWFRPYKWVRPYDGGRAGQPSAQHFAEEAQHKAPCLKKTQVRTKSEQRCIDILEKTLGRPFPTSYPNWLRWRGRDGRGQPRPMELDGYNEELGIALEFSGPLHTKHHPEYETYTAYFDRVCKDREKIRQCRENNVHLIVVDMRTPERHLDAYIKSRLADIGAVDIRGEPIYTANYMPAFVAEPYRNRPLEKELGLTCVGDEVEGGRGSEDDRGNEDGPAINRDAPIVTKNNMAGHLRILKTVGNQCRQTGIDTQCEPLFVCRKPEYIFG